MSTSACGIHQEYTTLDAHTIPPKSCRHFCSVSKEISSIDSLMNAVNHQTLLTKRASHSFEMNCTPCKDLYRTTKALDYHTVHIDAMREYLCISLARRFLLNRLLFLIFCSVASCSFHQAESRGNNSFDHSELPPLCAGSLLCTVDLYFLNFSSLSLFVYKSYFSPFMYYLKIFFFFSYHICMSLSYSSYIMFSPISAQLSSLF